jgi:hypothetical protein
MKKNLLLLFIVILGNLSSAQPTLDWVNGLQSFQIFPGSQNSNTFNVHEVDSNNVIIVGNFKDSIDVDPDTGVTKVISNGQLDILFAKYDQNGKLKWFNQIGSGINDIALDIEIDQFGNILIAGSFGGTVDFDPGAGVTTLTSFRNLDGFVAKYTSSGDFLWVKQFNGDPTVGMRDIAINDRGDIFLLGIISGPTNFDPGNSNFMLSSNGGTDIFILKLNSLGSFIWAKSFGGSTNDFPGDFTISDNGFFYIAGGFVNTVDFDPGIGVFNLSSNGSSDIFILKLDSNGSFVWAKSAGSASNDNGRNIVIHPDGDLVLFALFSDSVDFNFDTTNTFLSSNGITDVAVVKYSSNGNLIWARSIGNSNSNWIEDADVSPNGGIYFTGYFTDTLDLDPGSNSHLVNSNNNPDGYLNKLDSEGNFVWGTSFGGKGYDASFFVDAHRSSNVYFSGRFTDTALYGFNKIDTLITPVNFRSNAFFAKIINCIDSVSISASSCENYQFGNALLTESGNYQRVLYDVNGCDSIITLTLTIYKPSADTFKIINCIDYTWPQNGITYSNSGFYSDSLTDFRGCDSILVLDLTINQPSSETIKINSCGDYTWAQNSVVYSSTGIYVDTITNTLGCDSIVTLDLTINQPTSETVQVSSCKDYTWAQNSGVYNSSGTYMDTITNTYGCDSIVTLVLTINQPSADTLTVINCGDYTWLQNAITYSSSGIYADTLTNRFGCDSILTLDLTINQATSETVQASSCGDYFWPQNQTNYANSGIYRDTITNTLGCDSIVTLDLTVNQATSDTIQVSSCESYTWSQNQTSYTNSGFYIDTITNTLGCDSIVTLDLTINQTTSESIQISNCGEYVWAQNGVVYDSSGIYVDTLTNNVGCDSIVMLNLTVNKSTADTLTITSCDDYTWIHNGVTYAASGIYADTLINGNGCDSILVLDLTINQSTSETVQVHSCRNYTWLQNAVVYDSTGLYKDTITNVLGCDSIITLDLTVNSIDTSVTRSGFTLIANVDSAAYQWLDCNSNFQRLPADTNKRFLVITNGSYAAELTQNGCVDTSRCINVSNVGLSKVRTNSDIIIYPNPTGGVIYIKELNPSQLSLITILSIEGKVLESIESRNQNDIQLELNYPNGIYLLQISDNIGSKIIKIVKQ